MAESYYNVEKQRKYLLSLKSRYFRTVIDYPGGVINHHFDCRIYQSRRAYGWVACTCGLLHDLDRMEYRLAEKTYSEYSSDMIKQEYAEFDGTEEEKKRTKEQVHENLKLLREVFGEPDLPSLAEYQDMNKQDWQLVEEVFGEELVKRNKNKWKLIESERLPRYKEEKKV